MHLKTILISLFLVLTLSACAEEPVDTKQLLENFNKAVEANSLEQMESLILAKEGVEEKHVKAMANIYIKVLGDELKSTLQANREKNKLVNSRRTNYMMRGTLAFNALNLNRIIPEGERVKDGDKEYIQLKENEKETHALLLKSEGGTTKFWPEDIEANDDLLNLSNFLNEYLALLKNTSAEEYPAAFDKLIDEYVPATKLEFKEQEVKGMVDGEEKEVQFVLASQTTFRGKEVLELDFFVGDSKENCGRFTPKLFAINLPVNGETTYDFAKSGINGTLIKTNNSKGISNGKILLEKVDENSYQGKIAAERDGENYIYGNFTAEICK